MASNDDYTADFTGDRVTSRKREQQPLVDEFNDFVMMIAPKDWPNEARVAYNKLARRLEKAQ